MAKKDREERLRVSISAGHSLDSFAPYLEVISKYLLRCLEVHAPVGRSWPIQMNHKSGPPGEGKAVLWLALVFVLAVFALVLTIALAI